MTIACQELLPEGLVPYRDAFAYTAVIVLLLWKPQGLIVPRTARTRV